MGDVVNSSKEKHSIPYYILFGIFPIVFNIGLTIYLVVSNSLKYHAYVQRDTYELEKYNGSWYMYKKYQTTAAECPSSAAFNSNVTSKVYQLIVNNQEKSAVEMFTILYWTSTGLALLISVIENSLKIYRLRNSKSPSETTTNKCNAIFYFIYNQSLKKYSFVVSSYYISIFDFSKLCLERHNSATMFNLDYIPITFTGVIFGGPLILIDMSINIYNKPEYSYQCIRDRATQNCKNNCLAWCCCCWLCSGFVVTIPYLIFGFGTYLYVISLMEKGSRIMSVLIGADMILSIKN
jgi:hypothetical protein